jgi:hypothetical protein
LLSDAQFDRRQCIEHWLQEPAEISAIATSGLSDMEDH